MTDLAAIRQQLAHGISPREIMQQSLDRIRQWDDPALFLFQPDPAELLDEADRVAALPPDLPLRGVPFSVKDNIDVAGWPTTAACPDFSRIASHDATAVRLLREAGAIPIGKTNLDQFATGLVGTRSPHGIPRNAIAPDWLPGGSSSGSASAVAAGICPFALGTDTAGSGRVPAAFQELIGWKPSRGRVSTHGVIPACRSLDCVSVFSRNPADAALIASVLSRFDPADPFSRHLTPRDGFPANFRFGLPQPLDFAGDPDTPALFAKAIDQLRSLGGTPVPVEIEPFLAAARLLYEGPWVAERLAAIGTFAAARPEALFPVTRQILEAARGWDAVAAFQAQYRLAELTRETETVWKSIDFLLLPTTPRLYTIAENLADPLATNATLGTYTNFVNLLDLAALALPAGRARAGAAPWGISLAAPAGSDAALLEMAARFTGQEIPPAPRRRIPLLVCGAHMRGLPLHHQLVSRDARFVAEVRTAPCYRLFAMPAAPPLPPRPALVHDAAAGASIQAEIWELEPADFASFTAAIPAPLGIGKILLADGSETPGFIAEPRALHHAREITRHGGWRGWLAATSPSS